MYRKTDTITGLRRLIVADSIDKDRLMTKLIKLVREDERAKTIERMVEAKARAESIGLDDA